jgi:hypothetical protein
MVTAALDRHVVVAARVEPLVVGVFRGAGVEGLVDRAVPGRSAPGQVGAREAEREGARLPTLGKGQARRGRPHRHGGAALEDADVHVGTGVPRVRREVLLTRRRVFDRCHDASP